MAGSDHTFKRDLIPAAWTCLFLFKPGCDASIAGQIAATRTDMGLFSDFQANATHELVPRDYNLSVGILKL